MADYTWPGAAERSLIGKPLDRLDGPAKSTGAAKYPSDLSLDGMLHAKILVCPQHIQQSAIGPGTEVGSSTDLDGRIHGGRHDLG